MLYTCKYESPLGDILLAADKIGLTGLWFEGEKYFANSLTDEHISLETEILTETKKWLDVYFSGKKPNFTPTLHPAGSAFRQMVWQLLLQIPYGKTVTYGQLAHTIAEIRNIPRMSAQAVGGAVGHNEISIIIPCHRVVGTNGNLTGYAGGLDKKISLLELEHADMSHYFIPTPHSPLLQSR
jgi:methylated-DNA-[protein]-cysteine S-methyltransferase